MTKNLRDKLYQLENKKEKKVLNFMLTSGRAEGQKMLQTIFEVLGIYKNYKMMIINQNHLGI